MASETRTPFVFCEGWLLCIAFDIMTIMTKTKGNRARPQRTTEIWTVAEAKAHFSDLVEKAKVQGPQTITRHGRKTAIVVSVEEWARRSPRNGSLAEFLSQSPLVGSGLQVERNSDGARKSRL